MQCYGLNVFLQTTQSLLMLLYCQNLKIPQAKKYVILGSSQKRKTALLLSAWIFAITSPAESMCFKLAELIILFQCHCFIFLTHRGTHLFIFSFFLSTVSFCFFRVFFLNLQLVSFYLMKYPLSLTLPIYVDHISI